MTAVTDSSTMTAVGTTKRRSLHDAKERFLTTVREGVTELMTECGYSRERATRALLRELGGIDGTLPTDEEVFHLMRVHGVGLNAAAECLVVSKAVRKLMKHQGRSAIEAIDDLTSRLNLSNLLRSEKEVNSGWIGASVAPLDNNPAAKSKPLSEPSVEPQPSNRKNCSGFRKNSKARVGKPNSDIGRGKAMTGPGILSRKRTAEEVLQSESNGRPRADSVSEEVNAKMESSRPQSTEQTMAVVNRTQASRGKRSACLHDSQHTTASQPKRQRTDRTLNDVVG